MIARISGDVFDVDVLVCVDLPDDVRHYGLQNDQNPLADIVFSEHHESSGLAGQQSSEGLGIIEIAGSKAQLPGRFGQGSG